MAGKSDISHSHAWSTITGKPTTFAPSSHNHDDKYYTESEINNMLSLSGGRISCYKNGRDFEVSFDSEDGKNKIVFRLDTSTGELFVVHCYNGRWSSAREI